MEGKSNKKLMTKEQERAEHAWKCVRNGVSKDHANLAKSMPAMVMASGLMPALAFLEGKRRQGQQHHGRLLRDVVAWLAKEEILSSAKEFHEVMDDLKRMSAQEYQRAMEETLAILKWIRHFADALKREA